MRYTSLTIHVAALVLGCSSVLAEEPVVDGKEKRAEPLKEKEFECRFAREPIKIDGLAEESSWKIAQEIDNFYLPWLREKARPAKTRTKARLLWDRQYLYFFADMSDTDLYADITEHDGQIWYNDVFELFFQPAADKPGYYEFQVNAAGTVLDMFLPRRGAGGYPRFVKDGDFHIDAKVVCRGTLNQWQDRDEGWSVEGRIPWRDFVRTGGRPVVDEQWKFALCRYDYSVDLPDVELSTCAPLSSRSIPDFHHHEDYATLRFIGPDLGAAPAGAESAAPKSAAPESAAPESAAPESAAPESAAPKSAAPKSAAPESAEADRPTRLRQLQTAWRTVESRVVGSPDPPLPYRSRRVLPELRLSWPIFAVRQPGTRRLLFIDQQQSYGPARLHRTAETAESGEFETLWEFPSGGVGYSIAFHPRFDDNGFVFVGWNGTSGSDEKQTIVSRFTMRGGSPRTFDPQSRLDIIQWPSNGHNGGAVAFGKDGMLYVTSGDGTSDSDTNLTGQGLDHLLAKVLRIDVDHPDEGRNYSVPSDNPFAKQPTITNQPATAKQPTIPKQLATRPETWAYGLRNPWRIAVDPQTGAVWVGNNGQDLWEQIYLVQRGDNFGWSVYEGSHVFYANRQLGPTPHVKPTLEHPHSEARSLTGGVVYYGQRLPQLRGAYIYGDYSTGKIWGAKVESSRVVWHKELADTTLQITAIELDADGELLILDHRGDGQGGLHTLEPTPPSDDADDFPRTLTASGLFTSVADHKVHPGLLPYSVNAPLWSDGAHKERFLYLPPRTDTQGGAAEPAGIDHNAKRGWPLPDGTVAIKSFSLDMEAGNPASRRWIETRFLTRQQGEWVGYTYEWNEQQTEATLVEAGGADREFTIRQADGTTQSLAWRLPSRTECMVCHSRAANYVLGLTTLQMNKDHNYDGVTVNQLEVLEWLGELRVNWMSELRAMLRDEGKRQGKSDKEADSLADRTVATRNQRAPRPSTLLFKRAAEYDHLADPYDETADLAARARSYLHANCAQCHVEAGGGNAQIQLEFGSSLDKMNLLDVEPLHDKFNLANPRLIAAGAPERSVLLERLSRRGRGQMPQLATTQVDTQAVELLRRWIKSLPDDSPRPESPSSR